MTVYSAAIVGVAEGEYRQHFLGLIWENGAREGGRGGRGGASPYGVLSREHKESKESAHIVVNTDMQEKPKAKLRDIARPRPHLNATRDLRVSA